MTIRARETRTRLLKSAKGEADVEVTAEVHDGARQKKRSITVVIGINQLQMIGMSPAEAEQVIYLLSEQLDWSSRQFMAEIKADVSDANHERHSIGTNSTPHQQ